jgi:hypothetical protein
MLRTVAPSRRPTQKHPAACRPSAASMWDGGPVPPRPWRRGLSPHEVRRRKHRRRDGGTACATPGPARALLPKAVAPISSLPKARTRLMKPSSAASSDARDAVEPGPYVRTARSPKDPATSAYTAAKPAPAGFTGSAAGITGSAVGFTGSEPRGPGSSVSGPPAAIVAGKAQSSKEEEGRRGREGGMRQLPRGAFLNAAAGRRHYSSAGGGGGGRGAGLDGELWRRWVGRPPSRLYGRPVRNINRALKVSD